MICKRKLDADLVYLITSESFWDIKTTRSRVMISCDDPGVPGDQAKGICEDFIKLHVDFFVDEIQKRLTPEADEFEEGLVPTDICIQAGACEESGHTLNQMISQQDKKDKAIEAAASEEGEWKVHNEKLQRAREKRDSAASHDSDDSEL
eukprot:GHVR01127953.1.p1 GENE.GHVR01127953.1~~GHVR01127953.1.p1  ORF type:complete len:149 (-),score=47.49 GHVR01127953.1:381-827(-)